MNTLGFSRLRLVLGVWLWRHGWGWPLAATLCLAAALLWQFAVLPQRALRADLDDRLKASASASRSERKPMGDDVHRLAWRGLHAVLPPEADVDKLLARTFTLAQEEGLALEQADFQHRHDGEMQWLHVSMTVPIRGAYPRVRRFMESMLLEHPHVALDEIVFRRDAVGASQADAVARFSAWFQADRTAETGTAERSHAAADRRLPRIGDGR